MAKIANVMTVRVVQMNNTIKFTSACSLLFFVSLNSSADNNWTKREAHMQCGPALVQVNAECKNTPKNPTINICRSYTLKITKDNNDVSYQLPYMPDTQKKSLERQGYKFNKIVKAGDWAPQTLNCYDNGIVIVGYTTGISDEESVDDSLTSNTSAPFFDLDGNFITHSKEKILREKELRRQSGYLSINFTNNESGG